jgi:hypothetical protein
MTIHGIGEAGVRPFFHAECANLLDALPVVLGGGLCRIRVPAPAFHPSS